MNSLVALGTVAAYGFSLVATFAPGLLPAGTANVYFEAAAVIVVLILLGRWLEARAKGRTGEAIRKLVGLQPKTARVERDGEVVELPIDADRRRRHRSRCARASGSPVDGEVLSRRSYVDESMITGEPVPVDKAAGRRGGRRHGQRHRRADASAPPRSAPTRCWRRSSRMVEEAQGAKLPIQALVDRITRWFVPAVMAAGRADRAGLAGRSARTRR